MGTRFKKEMTLQVLEESLNVTGIHFLTIHKNQLQADKTVIYEKQSFAIFRIQI